MVNRSVEPFGRWRVFGPGMCRSDMIWHSVEHNFHPVIVDGASEVLVISKGAEVRIGRIHIGRAISVIGLRCAGVVVDRSGPDGCYTEVLEIIEVLLDAAEV